MKKVRLAMFGCGFHARRIYLPFIKKRIKDCELSLVVDLEENKSFVQEALSKFGLSHVPQIYLENKANFIISKHLSRKFLDIIDNLKISSCIISTEPLSHYEYLTFAIKNNLNVLVDKPLTLKKNLVRGDFDRLELIDDYKELISLLRESKSFVSCMAQRRYHPAINRIKNELLDCYKLVGVKPNSVFIQHADGQLRTPLEVKNMSYHGYKEGYGKCGHSGYHFFDLAHLYSSCFDEERNLDEVSGYSNFINADKYCQYINNSKISEDFKSNIQSIDSYGEVDAFMNYNLRRKDKSECSVSLSLLHNSLSARSWPKSNADLYKGNGRLRHETHIINVGPFMTIYYFSYQGREFLKDTYDGRIGQEGHSEVHIFRNIKLMSSEKDSYENIKFDKSGLYRINNYSRGHQEYSRWLCFGEFIDKHFNRKLKLKSSLEDHFYSVFFLNLAYKSQNKIFHTKMNQYE